jgi:hypothetical protein
MDNGVASGVRPGKYKYLKFQIICMPKGFSLTKEHESNIISAGIMSNPKFDDYYLKSSDKPGEVASQFFRLRFLREVAGGMVVEPYCVLHVVPKENYVSILNERTLTYALERWIEDPKEKGSANGFYYLVMENLDGIGIEAEAIREAALRRMLRSGMESDDKNRIAGLLKKLPVLVHSENSLDPDNDASKKLRRIMKGYGYDVMHKRILFEMKKTLAYLHSKNVAHGDPHGMNAFITDNPDRPLVLIDPANYCWCSAPSCGHLKDLSFFDKEYLKGYMRPFTSEGWGGPFNSDPIY